MIVLRRLLAFFLLLVPTRQPRAQESWPPALPHWAPFKSSSQRQDCTLHSEVCKLGIPELIDSNYNGLGREAARLQQWTADKTGICLNKSRSSYELTAHPGYFAASPSLG